MKVSELVNRKYKRVHPEANFKEIAEVFGSHSSSELKWLSKLSLHEKKVRFIMNMTANK